MVAAGPSLVRPPVGGVTKVEMPFARPAPRRVRTRGRRVCGLNVHRRHLTAEQKREAALQELTRDPSRSDRTIAKVVGVSGPTVSAVRATEKALQLPATTGADGKVRQRPAAKPVTHQIDRIRELHGEGHNVAQIARRTTLVNQRSAH